MRLRSLRIRLLAAAAVSISAALVAAGFGLTALFGHHVERRLDAQLESYLHELIGLIEPDADGGILVDGKLLDVRFGEPLSGLYWQIQDDEHRILIRSRSLWDVILELPRDRLELGVVHRHELAGPAGQALLAREQQVIVFPDTKAHRLRFVVAIDRTDLLAARADFARDLLPYLALLAGALMLATWGQVRMGLAPLHHVRRGVLAVRSGDRARIEDAFPDEVQPLVDEINELLESRDAAVDAARAWTADLAHGLKTPLTALGADAQRLRAAGEAAIADDLEELAQAMRQRVDRELIRARLRSEAAGRPKYADLAAVLPGLVNTLRRTPAGEQLLWEVDAPAAAEVRLAPADLAELLGNLLDNAAKWARQRVCVRVSGQGPCRVLIEDDGRGVPDDQLAVLGQRGLRLDQQTTGSGLGLAIARDIAGAYGVQMRFARSRLGGLAVSLELPVRQPV